MNYLKMVKHSDACVHITSIHSLSTGDEASLKKQIKEMKKKPVIKKEPKELPMKRDRKKKKKYLI